MRIPKFILSLTVLFLPLGVEKLYAQEYTEVPHNRYTSHGLTFGVGLSNVFDSYLSPLEYTGMEIRVQRETFRQTTFSDGRVYVQTLLNAHASATENKAGNANMYEGLLSWDLGYFYKFGLNDRLSILTGPALDLNGGVIYNERNSNNPAQAKVSVNLAASAMLLYRFHWLHKDFLLRYQATIPFLGTMFTPEYGESYYEIFELKDSGRHLVMTTPFSAPSLRQTLSLDFPVRQTLIRVSYVGDFQQSKVNSLKSHVWSHALLIGFVKNFQLIKPGDADFKKTPLQP